MCVVCRGRCVVAVVRNVVHPPPAPCAVSEVELEQKLLLNYIDDFHTKFSKIIGRVEAEVEAKNADTERVVRAACVNVGHRVVDSFCPQRFPLARAVPRSPWLKSDVSCLSASVPRQRRGRSGSPQSPVAFVTCVDVAPCCCFSPLHLCAPATPRRSAC